MTEINFTINWIECLKVFAYIIGGFISAFILLAFMFNGYNK